MEAMLWIKEVEMVESVDDLKSSRSITGTPGPDFELLDARTASALSKIIQNTRFKKKVSLEEMKAHKEDRFLRGRQIAYLIYEYFRTLNQVVSSASVIWMCPRTLLQSVWEFVDVALQLKSCRRVTFISDFSVLSRWCQKPEAELSGTTECESVLSLSQAFLFWK